MAHHDVVSQESREVPENPYLLDKISESMGRFKTVQDLLAYTNQGKNLITNGLTSEEQARVNLIISKLAQSKHAQYVLRCYGFDQIEEGTDHAKSIENLHAFLVKMYEETVGKVVKKQKSIELRLLLPLAVSLDPLLVSESGEFKSQFGVLSDNIRQILYRLRGRLGVNIGMECPIAIPWDSDSEQRLLKVFFTAQHESIGNKGVADGVRRLLACGADGRSSVHDKFGPTFSADIKEHRDEKIDRIERRLLVKDLKEFDELKVLADEGNEWAKMLVEYIQGATKTDLNHPADINGVHQKNLSHIFSVVKAVYEDPELGIEAIKSQDIVSIVNTIADRISKRERSDLCLAERNAGFCIDKGIPSLRQHSIENYALWRYRAMSCDVEDFLRRPWLTSTDMFFLCKEGVDKFIERYSNKFSSQEDICLFRGFFIIKEGELSVFNTSSRNKFLISWEYFRREKTILSDDEVDRLINETNDKFEKDVQLKAVMKTVHRRARSNVRFCLSREHDKQHPSRDGIQNFLTRHSTMPYMAVNNLIRFQKEGLGALMPIFRGKVGEVDSEDNAQ